MDDHKRDLYNRYIHYSLEKLYIAKKSILQEKGRLLKKRELFKDIILEMDTTLEVINIIVYEKLLNNKE